MLHTTDLSCEVCTAVHRFANLSVMVHFFVDRWFESWTGHKTVMIQVFNSFPQCLHIDSRIVPQLWWHNCFLLCLFWFITNYLSHHLTSSPYNPQTIYCLEGCSFCCSTFLPASVPLIEVILHVSCWWNYIHSRWPLFQSMGSKQGQELCGPSKHVSELLHYLGRMVGFQDCQR